MPRRPRRSRLGGSRGVPVLVPVRASPVPSVVRGSFVVKFYRGMARERTLGLAVSRSNVSKVKVTGEVLACTSFSGKQKGKQRVPSTLRFRKFPGKTEGVWCSILETREFP